VGFISAAEKKRTAELKATHELDDNGIDSQAGTAKA
jgi:hypothetical protein